MWGRLGPALPTPQAAPARRKTPFPGPQTLPRSPRAAAATAQWWVGVRGLRHLQGRQTRLGVRPRGYVTRVQLTEAALAYLHVERMLLKSEPPCRFITFFMIHLLCVFITEAPRFVSNGCFTLILSTR